MGTKPLLLHVHLVAHVFFFIWQVTSRCIQDNLSNTDYTWETTDQAMNQVQYFALLILNETCAVEYIESIEIQKINTIVQKTISSFSF